MTDIAELEVQINSDQAQNSIEELLRRMQRLDRQQDDIRQGQDDLRDSTRRLADGFDNLRGILAGVAGAISVAFFIDTARAMDEISARIKTATDSSEEFEIVMGSLGRVARDTTLTLDELTFSYQKLANQGIDVTATQLRGLAALATVMGRELEDTMDAARDAILFNAFDPLEEFGIFAEEQGNKIAVTFQGITTEIENSAESITEHLANIGNVTFADALENQMEGVNGAMARLEHAMGAVSKTATTLLSPALAAIINDLADILRFANAAARAIFNLSNENRDLTERIDKQRATIVVAYNAMEIARARLEEIRKEQGELSQDFREGEAVLEGARSKYDQLVQGLQTLGLEYQNLKPKIEQATGESRGEGGGGETGGTGLRGFAGAADNARLSLTDLIVSIRTTRDEIAAMSEAEAAGFTLASLEEQLRSYETRGIEFSLDFATKFWDIFQNQGEFTLESLIGTFQAWGLEIAQSQVFDDLFADLQKGLGQALSNLLGGGLAGFGVGATAGGLAGGGGIGLLAGILGGAGTGFLAGGGLPGALLGGGLGGLGAVLGGFSSGGGQDQYSFSVGGGLGALRGFAGPDAGNFSQFISFVNDLEQALSAAIGPRQLGEIEAALEDFRSASIRMAEGGFEAERAMGLVTGRLETLVEGMGPGFLRLFRQLSDGTAESTAAAVESLLAVDAAMDLFNVRFKDAESIIEAAARQGETYAQTLARVAAAQDTLQRALYTAEERQAQTLADAQEQIDEFNASLGLTGDAAIDTREELQAYNETLDRSQQSQHEALLELLEVAGAFQLIFEAAEAAAPAIEETAEAIDELEAEAFDASNVIRNVVSLLNDYVNWQYRLAEAINATTGAMASWELSLAQANDTVALFNTVVAAGGPLESQMQLFNQAFQQFQTAYNQAMQQIAQDLQNRISAIRDEYAELIEEEREAFDLRRQALQDELEITRAWAGTLSSVEGIIAGLQSGGLSPFGPTGQYAIGASNLAALQAQYAGATGAQQAVLGTQLAQALQAQLGLAQGIFGIGSTQYLEEYNDTITQLTAIQEQAAAEAARQSELEQALVDLQEEQAVRLEQLNQQMDTEIAAAEQHAQNQIDTVNQFAAGVYAEFERIGNQLYQAMLEQMRQQAEFERQGREIQAEQLAALLVIRDGFLALGLDPTSQARANARAARYI